MRVVRQGTGMVERKEKGEPDSIGLLLPRVVSINLVTYPEICVATTVVMPDLRLECLVGLRLG